jgi:CspA family cold shock protein
MESGTVKWFNESKGFGFIKMSNGDEVFVHHKSIVGEGYKSLNEGDQVEFEIMEDPRGPRAIAVKKVEAA